jgi:hypothetical protein
MIKKPRKVPKQIEQLEAILKRLAPDHLKVPELSANLSKRLAGYKGEKGLDYPLSFLADEQYHIFHDLRLFDGTHYFQIDTLILSQRLILLLEVKNIMGTLYFDSNFNQLIRTLDEKKEPFPDPIIQSDRHCDQLRKWLLLYNFMKIPIESLVVISSSRTILDTSPNNEQIYNKVIHSGKLPFKIKSLNELYHKERLNRRVFLELSNELLNGHRELEVNILKQYKIDKSELIKGVQCPDCFVIPMERGKGNWVCLSCGLVSKCAHVPALKDYSILIGTTITNQEARDFLKIPSSTVVKKLLISMGIKSVGKNKGRVYILDFD